MNRRTFINSTAITAAGVGMAGLMPAHAAEKTPDPSDILNVALVGCRNMGFGILEHHLSNPGVKCVALCDIDDSILNNRATEVQKRFNQTPRLYKDFRKLLEQKDIDSVIIGTPDHWHCLILVSALQAGKHVMSRNQWPIPLLNATLL